MNLLRCTWTLAIALAVAPRLYGATAGDAFPGYVYTTWTTEDGLPSAAITSMAQDAEGYLWLASAGGLVRFDGVRFVSWQQLGGPAIPDAAVRSILTSRDGSLWLGFRDVGGISRIHNGRVQSYPPVDGLPIGSIRTLFEDSEGTVWAGGASGLARLRDGRWEQLLEAHGLPEATTVDNLYQARNGDLFAATSAGVLLRNRARDLFEPTESGTYRGLDVTEDMAGSIWVGGHLRPFTPLKTTNWSLSPPSNEWGALYGYSLLRDGQGRLWVATLGQGLLHVPSPRWGDGAAVQLFTRKQGLANDRAVCLLEDREGGIWIGTQGGLTRLTEVGERPVKIRAESAGRTVRAVAMTADGSLWTGTEAGLHQLRNGTSKWYGVADGLPSDTIRVLHAGADATLWIATARGPARLSADMVTPLALPPGIRLDRVEAMTTDPDGGLWLCDFRGIYRWVRGHLTPMKVGSGVVRTTPASSAFTDSLGRVWIGFSGGGLVVRENGTFRNYSSAEGLSGGAVRVIHEDAGGTIWVGTFEGISRFDNGRFVSIDRDNGLPGHAITAIQDDPHHGHLWIGTDAGLVRIKVADFDEAARTTSRRVPFRLLDPFDGVEGVPTAPGRPTSLRRPDGTMWIVTSDGVAVVDPRAVREYPLPHAPFIERARVDQNLQFTRSNFIMPARSTRIEFEFASLTSLTPSKVLYRFRLEGYDDQWVLAGTQPSASYTSLPPRRYRFLVSASRNGSDWVDTPTAWEFSVAPAFYQTSWFYLTLVTASAMVILVSWRLRLHQVHRQFALVVEERERLAREIHDTLLQGMLGVALQLHGIAESPDHSTKQRCERARDSLERYIRETRESILALRSPQREGRDLARSLGDFADVVAGGSPVDVSLRVDGAGRRLTAPVEENLLRIGQEAISNAVRHAAAAHLRIELSYEAAHVALRIVDDGIGFNAELTPSAGVHMGLSSMRERAEQMGGRLTVVSERDKGTRVDVVVPSTERSAMPRWANRLLISMKEFFRVPRP
jgi:signal transduction histidine kinase/ligand-binding sensor domain-containing protein